MTSASSLADSAASRSADSSPRPRSAATARAAFVHAVCCVRMAPTAISYAERPGHQCCSPNRRRRSRYMRSRRALTGSSGGPGIRRRAVSAGRPERMLGVILLQALTVAVSGPATSLEYLPLRVAHAEGYFAREGLDVTLKTTRGEPGAAEALTQG